MPRIGRTSAIAEAGDEDLRYATNASGAWAVETIDTTGPRGYHSDVALDPDGAVHIVYRAGDEGLDPAGTLLHATNASGAWAIETIDDDPDAGRYGSLAIDPSGTLHVSYVANGEARYATNPSAVWETRALADADCSDTSIAVDDFGFRHVAFRKGATDEAVYATDTPRLDRIDENCDGVDGIDADGDGRASIESGGDDPE